MEKNVNFLNALDDWGTILTNTYEDAIDEYIILRTNDIIVRPIHNYYEYPIIGFNLTEDYQLLVDCEILTPDCIVDLPDKQIKNAYEVLITLNVNSQEAELVVNNSYLTPLYKGGLDNLYMKEELKELIKSQFNNIWNNLDRFLMYDKAQEKCIRECEQDIREVFRTKLHINL